MKTKSIEWWNSLPKSEDVDSKAIEGDNVVLIDGIAFLVQRKNNFNNVVCWRVKNNKNNLVSVFCKFRKYCKNNKLQYIRVEGIGKHTYKILFLVLRHAPQDAGVIYSEEESEKYNRHIWFVKTY